MTNPFMRVDISQNSRDFQPVVLEPGLPLLDRSNSNGQTLRKWLGTLVAEPERTGDRVAFYARDDESRRIDSVFCVPITEKDLAGELSKDFRELQQRIGSVKAQSATEQLIYRAVSEQIRGLADENSVRDRRICLFKFRDGRNKLHLVWAPGYRRRDNEPATPLVCTNPTCSHLFLQRGDSIQKCHICQAVGRASNVEKQPHRYISTLGRLVACACLVALGFGGTLWWRKQPENQNIAKQPDQTVLPASKQEPGKLVSLRLISGQGASMTIPLGAEFSEWKVEGVANDGTATDVSKAVTLVVDNDPANSALTNSLLRPSKDQGLDREGDQGMVSVVIRGGCIVGINPGESTVHAVYGGLRTESGLKVDVTRNLDVDEIRVIPASVNLVVGECVSLKAIGFKSGNSIGDITSRGEVDWQTADETCVAVDGPQITAGKAGLTKLTAVIGSLTSKPIKASVVDSDPAENAHTNTGPLTVEPSRLRMKAGEVLKLGHEISIKRQSTDFSESCDVVVAANRSVIYDDASRILRATSPGHSRITFIVRDQSATLDVEVEPHAVPAADSNIIIEPSNGKLAVGEKMSLRTFIVTPDGTRIPMDAALTSNAPDAATISGAVVQGVAPGEVTVQAMIPGIDQAGRAMFTVEHVEFDRLAFNPASLTVAIGQRKSFEVFGVTATSRVRLGEDPKLELIGVGADEDSGSDLSGSASCEIFGLFPGKGAVIASWNGKLKQKMPVTVELDRILELVILPNDMTVAESESVDYQIMARREGRLQPLEDVDGVELTVDNPEIAAEKDLRVSAIKPGKTQVVAKYGNLRTVAELTVTQRSRSVETAALPKGLRFLSDILQIELGDSAGQVQVVRVLSDGREENVDGHVTLKVRGSQDVVEVEPTTDGALIHPKKVGNTRLEASLGNLRAQRPFFVEVLPQTPRQPELRARPESLRILVGETKQFRRAVILPVSSGRPIPVPFTVTATPNKFIEVGSDGSIRGLAAGTAVVTITADDPEEKYAGIENSAIVEVVEP